MNGILADTGPLYAAYDPSDRYHKQSRAEIEYANQQGLTVILPYSIFLESHSLILKRLGIAVGLAFVQQMTAGTVLLQPLKEDYDVATQILQRYPDQTITLFDATTTAIAKRLALPVWTYDFHFDVMGAVIWR